jgi:hypothetical protein
VLTKLSLAKNKLGNKKAGKVLGEMLAANTVLKELDVSGNHCDTTHVGADGPGFAQMLAARIKDNGALSKLIFGGDKVNSWDPEMEPATLEVGMSEANFSKKNLGVGGASIISAWLTHKDNGALTRLDISKNKLFNHDGTAAGKILSDMLAVNSTIQELDVSGNAEYSNSNGGPSFVQALAVGISDNRALTSLNLSSNNLKAKGAEIVTKAIKVTKYLCDGGCFGTIYMLIWPLVELLLFAAIHRITGLYCQ